MIFKFIGLGQVKKLANAIKIEDLDVYYGDFCVLNKINLVVEKDDFLGIIGPNGGGKTTLLRVILGLLEPSAGSVRIFDRIPHQMKGQIGFVPQLSRLKRNFPVSVKEVVLMGRLSPRTGLFHVYSQRDKEVATLFMKKLDVYHLKERQIGRLSLGQLQRVLIARALVSNPRILLLDEPTASVDIQSKNKIYSLLKELNKNIPIVLVTHDIGIISSYIGKIACLNKELHYHGETELNENLLKHLYGCPVELIAHGVPHRVFAEHKGGEL